MKPLAGGAADTQSYSYDVFGGLRSGAPGATDRLFTGEQLDANARANAGGLYYLRAGYYDPSIGRVLSRDPLPGPLEGDGPTAAAIQ